MPLRDVKSCCGCDVVISNMLGKLVYMSPNDSQVFDCEFFMANNLIVLRWIWVNICHLPLSRTIPMLLIRVIWVIVTGLHNWCYLCLHYEVLILTLMWSLNLVIVSVAHLMVPTWGWLLIWTHHLEVLDAEEGPSSLLREVVSSLTLVRVWGLSQRMNMFLKGMIHLWSI